jgi:hypothetical protein
MVATRHFDNARPLRTLEEISVSILSIEKEVKGLLDGLQNRSPK